MRKRRKIIVYIATSVDSYIARPDGDVRWLDRPHPKGSYGMGSFFKTIDTILWGRKTYSKGIEMGMKPRWQGDWFVDSGYGSGIKNYVFSRQSQASAEPEAKFVNEPVKTFAQRLRAQSGRNIWMMGGGLIASFLDEGEIDEFSIHVIPVLIGEGIPLVQPRHRMVQLKLLCTKAFPDGVVHLHYRVIGKRE